ncbi:hypothetical protein [Novosphingobium cyanobacteriorum]|uniref:Uncharacterized protein n=1 Tax=Novosphingobium cyanobacteriorum TaxID=3024215 RepID=A0ABT6CKM3_9SPHN|nr:hypothetical protein [Novosphingobium cyanobacteriorum]MDF8334480.1 hypothetical protein [Novosphingobium cyanobacteriorum]
MQITDWPARVAGGRHARRLENALRLAGLVIIAFAGVTCLGERHEELLYGLSPWPMAIAVLAVVLFWIGLILLVGGAELFRQQPVPPRSWLPSRKRTPR